jgi:glucose-6-phosphate-specific signal transduction histidine kinase
MSARQFETPPLPLSSPWLVLYCFTDALLMLYSASELALTRALLRDCFTSALLLLYFCFTCAYFCFTCCLATCCDRQPTFALLLLYVCFTSALLLLYFCFTHAVLMLYSYALLVLYWCSSTSGCNRQPTLLMFYLCFTHALLMQQHIWM